MLSRTVRQAQAQDASILAELVFAAAPEMLSDLLAAGDEAATRTFLHFSFAQAEGQYGFANHWLIQREHQPVGVITFWHDQLPSQFDAATVNMIHEHFGLSKSVQILQRNQALTGSITPPQEHQIAVGHLSVLPAYRRQGVASELLAFARQFAADLAKSELIIDVERVNHAALRCYQQQGFKPVGNPTADMLRLQQSLPATID